MLAIRSNECESEMFDPEVIILLVCKRSTIKTYFLSKYKDTRTCFKRIYMFILIFQNKIIMRNE